MQNDVEAIVRGLSPKEVRGVLGMSDTPRASGTTFHETDAEMLIRAYRNRPLAICEREAGRPATYRLTAAGLSVQSALRAAKENQA